jgi:hypothetical protein
VIHRTTDALRNVLECKDVVDRYEAQYHESEESVRIALIAALAAFTPVESHFVLERVGYFETNIIRENYDYIKKNLAVSFLRVLK